MFTRYLAVNRDVNRIGATTASPLFSSELIPFNLSLRPLTLTCQRSIRCSLVRLVHGDDKPSPWLTGVTRDHHNSCIREGARLPEGALLHSRRNSGVVVLHLYFGRVALDPDSAALGVLPPRHRQFRRLLRCQPWTRRHCDNVLTIDHSIPGLPV